MFLQVEGLTDLVDDAITVIDDTADDIIETIDDTWDDVSDTAGDVVDDVGDVVDDVGETAGDVVDGAGDVVDDVGDTAGDVIDDAGDAWDDFTGGWRQLQQQKRRHRRRLQREEEKRRLQTVEVTAEVDFAFGASLDGGCAATVASCMLCGSHADFNVMHVRIGCGLFSVDGAHGERFCCIVPCQVYVV